MDEFGNAEILFVVKYARNCMIFLFLIGCGNLYDNASPFVDLMPKTLYLISYARFLINVDILEYRIVYICVAIFALKYFLH
jgi:hypothetical protein